MTLDLHGYQALLKQATFTNGRRRWVRAIDVGFVCEKYARGASDASIDVEQPTWKVEEMELLPARPRLVGTKVRWNLVHLLILLLAQADLVSGTMVCCLSWMTSFEATDHTSTSCSSTTSDDLRRFLSNTHDLCLRRLRGAWRRLDRRADSQRGIQLLIYHACISDSTAPLSIEQFRR